ncbi:MAG: hypothetical protein EXR55_01225 [Dehalococcoidia bacterium]|nr:hypothetical protein [Dehalococcoidia bacterium]
MSSNLTAEHLRQAIHHTIASNSIVVNQWLANEPGNWGFLAGKAVLACRDQVGRRLTDLERRMVWQELWNALTELRLAQRGGREEGLLGS